MARGRHYYDPELQTTKLVEGEKDLSRIELFPVGQDSTSRLPDEFGKWVARRIHSDGTIDGYTGGDFNHDRALVQAEEMWPGLQVFELRSEIEDSTWEGHGPSPRIWQNAIPPAVNPVQKMVEDGFKNATPEEAREMMGEVGRLADALSAPPDEQVQLRVLPITETGAYVLLADLNGLLEMWASQYEEDKNPSAALALRDVVDALKDAG